MTVNDLPQKEPREKQKEPGEKPEDPASERARAGARAEPSLRGPHRRRLASSGPGHLGGFRAPEIAGTPMEAALPAGSGAPQPQAPGGTLLHRIKGKLFTW